MGYTEAADGTLTMDDDASDPRGDFQKIADLAAKLGGLLRGTADVRNSLTDSMTQIGWLFVETDTRIIYQRVAGGWERATRNIAGVRVSGDTNSNGIILVPNPFGTIALSWIQVTVQNNGNDGFGKILSAIVWDLPPLGTGGGIQVRVRREDTHDWTPNLSVNLYVTMGIG